MNRTFDQLRPPAARPPSPARPLAFFLPTSACTLDGFRAWYLSGKCPDYVRLSFIGSEIFIDMGGERVDTHVVVKGEISRVLATLVKKEGLGRFVADGALLTHAGAGVSNQPDALFATWDSIERGHLRLVPAADGNAIAELAGTPDMVLEVVSPDSVAKDTNLLRSRYHAAGIPEHWLVDARGSDVAFQILSYGTREYVAVPASRGGWVPSAVFRRKFKLTRTRDRVGVWEYTLHVRR
jgi:Uma2 family endonuclease